MRVVTVSDAYADDECVICGIAATQVKVLEWDYSPAGVTVTTTRSTIRLCLCGKTTPGHDRA